ncbi:glycosyltransferase family 39 protein [Saccharopolyspora erythraea]|uniref:glycosyltransferase family 39 protein n=1 Tax=Saccharopolyspora erythraea TaxID=1836 RepID=UPI001BA96774|nr:glycosyltransferase family 39 protein [Saccharopolyspora erythraea]QUH00432.1 glycosyltransferase family 39 protein [Saccharopolyspora erythraea]
MNQTTVEPAATPGEPGTSPPAHARLWPPGWWPVLSIAAVVAAVHVAISPFGGYWIDEVYMLAVGRYHPDWGYADQPPVAPLLARAMDWIAPDWLPLLRLPAALASAATVVLTALIARELGADRRAQVIAAAAAATGLWAAFVGHWVTPYTLEPPLWLLMSWLLVRWVRLHGEGRADDRLLLALGGAAGVAAQTKFQVFAFAAALLCSVLVFGPRSLLRRPMLWAGVGIALLVAFPTLLWQAAHDWPQLRMAGAVVSESPMLSGGRIGTARNMVLFAGVAGAFLLCFGVWRLLTAAELRAYRFFGVSVVLLYVLFLATAARPYYLVSIYGVALAAGAVGLQRRRERGRTRLRWVAWPAFALSAAGACAIAMVSAFSAQAWAQFGLAGDLTKETAAAYQSLPAEMRSRTAILGKTYIQAAILDVSGTHAGLPNTYSLHRGYGYFDPPGEETEHVLYVGSDLGGLPRYFARVEQVGSGEQPVWLLTGKQERWEVIWPRLRHL